MTANQQLYISIDNKTHYTQRTGISFYIRCKWKENSEDTRSGARLIVLENTPPTVLSKSILTCTCGLWPAYTRALEGNAHVCLCKLDGKLLTCNRIPMTMVHVCLVAVTANPDGSGATGDRGLHPSDESSRLTRQVQSCEIIWMVTTR